MRGSPGEQKIKRDSTAHEDGHPIERMLSLLCKRIVQACVKTMHACPYAVVRLDTGHVMSKVLQEG